MTIHSTRYSLLVLFLFFSAAMLGQRTINGTVRDGENGETLIGATVRVQGTESGTFTNTYGFFSLSLPADTGTLQVSYVGYRDVLVPITPAITNPLSIDLFSGQTLEEVVVKSNSFREQLSSTQMSVQELTMREAKLIPVVFGEVDIIKTLQLKPGINSGSEGNSGLFVRGGSADQNLFILDEATVYNPNHLFGFFSTFNSDAVKDVKIYKGGFPAQYGGRLSSVIDVKLNEGNNQKFSGTGGIGLISSRLTLEAPLVKNKSSMIISGRRTYADLITRSINRANEDNPDYNPIPDYYFYDLNTKINYTLSDKDRLYLSGYFGQDRFGFDNENFNFNFNWGNATGTARWNRIISPTLFGNTTFTYSDYNYEIANALTGFSFNLQSRIRDMNLKSDLTWSPNNEHHIRMGGELTRHQFTVGRLKAGSDDGEISFSAGQDLTAWEAGLYFQDDWTINDRSSLSAGLRLSGFLQEGHPYGGIEPRLAYNYRLTPVVSLKANYARMYQYLHLVANSSISLPTDIWYPSTAGVRPQISDQVGVGWQWLLGSQFLLSNEYYYKHLDNQIDFKNFADLFANDELEREFTFGKGYAYGTEVYFEKKEGRLTGWVGYTLAFVRRGEFSDIMGGRYFAPRYDRRHDISIVGIYEITPRVTATAAWVYGSGDLSWLPVGRLPFQDIPGGQSQPVVPVYGDRNNLRQPAYHRLDLGLVIGFKPRWGESDLTISIYNAYNRRNPYFLYLDAETRTNTDLGIEEVVGIKARQVSLFPILPALTYNFTF
ncbi:MAG TPA: TonB-dependent receptor [Saprospiraceae bacterium]|nr:TonB-dependent receptor [Saprospiraceae bacterium]HRW75343.1 TonB-dependent receptor [Saprospiraceae bacterium]